MAKRIYKTMQGKVIDMEALMTNNETMPAVGNAKMNARGDELGPGGKIIRTKEELVSEYYEDNPNSLPKENSKKEKPVIEKKEEPIKIKETPVITKKATSVPFIKEAVEEIKDEKEDKKKV